MRTDRLATDMPAGGRANWAVPLLAAAAAVGRLPGEPPVIIAPRAKPWLLGFLIGSPVRRPLSDPALEVVRAISASLANGAAAVNGDLLAAAYQAGLTPRHLRATFPNLRLDERPS
jgi:hypothetical protein